MSDKAACISSVTITGKQIRSQVEMGCLGFAQHPEFKLYLTHSA